MFAAQVWVELMTRNNWHIFPGFKIGPGLHLVWDINKHTVASARDKTIFVIRIMIYLYISSLLCLNLIKYCPYITPQPNSYLNILKSLYV